MTRETTPWYPRNVRPVRKGVYQVVINPDAKVLTYARWDGKVWYINWGMPGVASKEDYVAPIQDIFWRGLIKF